LPHQGTQAQVSGLNQTVSAESKKLCQYTIRSLNRPSLQLTGNLPSCLIPQQFLDLTAPSGSKVIREPTNRYSDRGRCTAIHTPKRYPAENLWSSPQSRNHFRKDPNRISACSLDKLLTKFLDVECLVRKIFSRLPREIRHGTL